MGIAILPTSWSSAAVSSSCCVARVEPELLGGRDGELDDRAAVAGGVVVVGLDDVGEDHHGAAVGLVQLEGGGVALRALLGEDGSSHSSGATAETSASGSS